MADATADITVLVGAGAYQDTNITIGPADSGKSSTAKLVIRQQDGNGTPELWGGHVQTGWMTHSGPVMKSAIAGRVYTLYENGVRAVAARTPDLSTSIDYPTAFAPYFTSTGVTGSTT